VRLTSQGVRGVLIGDGPGDRVCVIWEPASDYYGVMTRGAWAPVLIGDRI
jgi:hypothetical protein